MVNENDPNIKSMLFESTAWQEIITSENWKYFKELLREHKNFLNKQALLSIDNRNNDEATFYRVRARECDAILQLVDGRLAELKTNKKGGEEDE